MMLLIIILGDINQKLLKIYLIVKKTELNYLAPILTFFYLHLYILLGKLVIFLCQVKTDLARAVTLKHLNQEYLMIFY